MLNRTFTWAVLCAAALSPLAAIASDSDARSEDGRLPVTDVPQDTLIVVRDAQTGKLRGATSEERAALQSLRASNRVRALSAVAATPQLKRHASGATGVRMTDDMLAYSVMVRRADGSLEELCFPSRQEAEAAVVSGLAVKAELPTK